MSAARVFPLAAPLFDVGAVTITKKAKALLERQGLTPHELVDRFRRCDWPEDEWDLFGQNMVALRNGESLFVQWSFDAPPEASGMHVCVDCDPGEKTFIETGTEYLHRSDPERQGPEGEWPKEIWGKGVYTAPAVEIVKAGGAS